MAIEKVPVKRGKKIPDEVSIKVNNEIFDGWQNVSVTKNLESIANRFSINLFDKFDKLRRNWPLKPGVSVEININSQRVLTGRIEKLNVNFNNTNRNFNISGRSNAGDLVDSMHVGAAEFKNITLDKLAEELVSPFGIKVFLSVVPQTIATFSVKPGETVFEALDRAARLQGFFFVSTREGNIRLTKAARARALTSLEQDVNILSASAVYDDSQRHDQYIVKGQTIGLPDFFGADVSQPEGSARDAGVLRHRPFIMIAEGNVDSAQAKTRAEWEASNRLAKALKIDVVVQGWTQSEGTIWGINQLIPMKSKFLGLNRDLLISSVSHTDGTIEGKTTTLTLTDPQAFNTNPTVNKDVKDDIFASLGANFK